MKVLLRSDVDGVGKRGDIIDVAGGFARNYLLPTGRAIVAGGGVEAQAEAMRRSRDLRDAKDRESSETVARRLVGTTITIPASRMIAATLDWISCHMIRSPGSLIRQPSPPKTVIAANDPAAAAESQSTILISRPWFRPATAAQSSPAVSVTAEAWTSRQTVA